MKRAKLKINPISNPPYTDKEISREIPPPTLKLWQKIWFCTQNIHQILQMFPNKEEKFFDEKREKKRWFQPLGCHWILIGRRNWFSNQRMIFYPFFNEDVRCCKFFKDYIATRQVEVTMSGDRYVSDDERAQIFNPKNPSHNLHVFIRYLSTFFHV